MRLPIDTASVKFAAAGPAQPVLDYETRAPKLDENGVALFNVPLFAAGGGIQDSITNLVASTWEVGTNHGVSFRADRIELAKASA